MRDILFRGKRTDNGEWVEGHTVLVSSTDSEFAFIIQHGSEFDVLVDDFGSIDKLQGHISRINLETLGQFTGLVDKKGKRIYEGDIITIPNSMKKGLPGVVIYHIPEAKFVLSRYGYSYINLTDCHTWGYVIGNAQDNPELLEVRK